MWLLKSAKKQVFFVQKEVRLVLVKTALFISVLGCPRLGHPNDDFTPIFSPNSKSSKGFQMMYHLFQKSLKRWQKNTKSLTE